MRKELLFIALSAATLCANAQTSSEVRTLTFEDGDYKGTGNVFGKQDWSSLIDDSEYGGQILYGDQAATYKWYDEGNTELKWDGFIGGQPFYSGGIAISDYYEDDLSVIATEGYQRQLSVPLAESSNTFGVVCAYRNIGGDNTYSPACAPLYFSDGKARTIESVDVMNTAYTLCSLTYGDSYAAAATDESEFTVHFVGTRDDNTTGEVTYLLADGRNFVTDWTKVDLTPLGDVKQIEIYVTGSDDLCGAYGLNTPGYVAIDNIAVRFGTTGIESVDMAPADLKSADTRGGVTEVARFDANGNRLLSPKRGVNIVRMSDGSVRKVVVK